MTDSRNDIGAPFPVRAGMDGPPVRMMKRSHTVRDASVEDVAIWCIEQDLDPRTVLLAGVVGLRWQSPETKRERELREEWDREQVERLEKWERETLVRLMEKYGVRRQT